MMFFLFLQKKERGITETWHNCAPGEDKWPRWLRVPVKYRHFKGRESGCFWEIDRRRGDIFRVAKEIGVCYNMHQTRM